MPARGIRGGKLAQEILRISEQLEGDFRREFLDEVASYANNPVLKKLLKDIESGSFTAGSSLSSSLANITFASSRLDALARKAMGRSARITAKTTTGFELGFNVINPEVVAVARTMSINLSTSLNKSTRETLRKIIQDAVEGNLTTIQAARKIRTHVGLIPKHADAVDRYYETLVQSGVKTKLAQKQADAYAQRLLKYRSETIARTEIARAVGEGQTAMWKQMVADGYLPVDAKRVWVTALDERTCEICEPMNGVETDIFGSWNTPNGFVSHPQATHPNCRCTQGIIMPKSKVGKSDELELSQWLLSKENPYHDEIGRFTFAPEGARTSLPENGNKKVSLPKVIQEFQKSKLPAYVIESILAEAKNHETPNSFRQSFSAKSMQGVYTHLTSSKDFSVDPSKKTFTGMGYEQGMFVSSAPEQWKSVMREEIKDAEHLTLEEKNKKISSKAQYLAIITMPNAPKGSYVNTTAGDGHQVFVKPEALGQMKVHAVMPYQTGVRAYKKINNQVWKILTDGDLVGGGNFREKLNDIWEYANSNEVSKFNPYHDELGRFTFAPEGVKGTQTRLARQRSVSQAKNLPVKYDNLRYNIAAIIEEDLKEFQDRLDAEPTAKGTLIAKRGPKGTKVDEDGLPIMLPEKLADKKYGSNLDDVMQYIADNHGIEVSYDEYDEVDPKKIQIDKRILQGSAQFFDDAKKSGIDTESFLEEVIFTEGGGSTIGQFERGSKKITMFQENVHGIKRRMDSAYVGERTFLVQDIVGRSMRPRFTQEQVDNGALDSANGYGIMAHEFGHAVDFETITLTQKATEKLKRTISTAFEKELKDNPTRVTFTDEYVKSVRKDPLTLVNQFGSSEHSTVYEDGEVFIQYSPYSEAKSKYELNEASSQYAARRKDGITDYSRENQREFFAENFSAWFLLSKVKGSKASKFYNQYIADVAHTVDVSNGIMKVDKLVMSDGFEIASYDHPVGFFILSQTSSSKEGVSKANPYHDEIGRFTFAPEGAKTSLPQKPPIKRKPKQIDLDAIYKPKENVNYDKRQNDIWRDGDGVQEAIGAYTNHGLSTYVGINKNLRKGVVTPIVKALDRGFVEFGKETTKETVVYRGSYLPKKVLEKIGITKIEEKKDDGFGDFSVTTSYSVKKNAKFTELSFMSTSTSADIASKFTEGYSSKAGYENVLFKITVPKGKKVISGSGREKELIFNRGETFIVKKVVKDSSVGSYGAIVVDLEMVSK